MNAHPKQAGMAAFREAINGCPTVVQGKLIYWYSSRGKTIVAASWQQYV